MWLEQEGLVRPLPIVGLTVAELSEADMDEVFGLLTVLESYAARLAVAHMTEKQIKRLEAACDQSEEVVNTGGDRLSERNWRFHELLVEGSGNGRLQGIVRNLRAAMQPYRAMTLTSTRFRKQSVVDHRKIVALLRAKSTDRLEAFVATHLKFAREVTVAALRERASRLASDTFPHPVAPATGRARKMKHR